MWRRRPTRRNVWAATTKSCSGSSRRVPTCHLPLLPFTEPSSPALIFPLTLTLQALLPPHTPVLLATVRPLTRWLLRDQGRPLWEAHQQHAHPPHGSQMPTLYPDELSYWILAASPIFSYCPSWTTVLCFDVRAMISFKKRFWQTPTARQRWNSLCYFHFFNLRHKKVFASQRIGLVASEWKS